MQHKIRVGCAGWSIPKAYTSYFPATGTHLERYGTRFAATEINSSFYRQHKPATYARWSSSVPSTFRFAVKLPREITHRRRLTEPALLDDFLCGPRMLGDKLEVLLVQIPPSLNFTSTVVSDFFAALRKRFNGGVVCEPRHPSWFAEEVERVLIDFQVTRAAVDPSVVPQAGDPGGWDGLIYHRLHGTPKRYYSAYSQIFLDELMNKLSISGRTAPTWCIFDNTASDAAIANALATATRLESK